MELCVQLKRFETWRQVHDFLLSPRGAVESQTGTQLLIGPLGSRYFPIAGPIYFGQSPASSSQSIYCPSARLPDSPSVHVSGHYKNNNNRLLRPLFCFKIYLFDLI